MVLTSLSIPLSSFTQFGQQKLDKKRKRKTNKAKAKNELPMREQIKFQTNQQDEIA